ncbi:MAG: hypothetical protein ABI183_19285 [Polyangiaceae bacterium]
MPAKIHQMRATHTKSLLRSVRKLLANEQTQILETFGRDRVEKVDGAIAVGWLPMTVHMGLSDAIRAVIGSTRNIQIWRETMTETYDRVLLRGFIDATVGLFGLTPASLFRQGPYIHRQLTRGLGELSVEEQADKEGGIVSLFGFPAQEFDLDCYAEGLQGCLESSITRGRGKGTITLTDKDDKRGNLRFHAVWRSVI